MGIPANSAPTTLRWCNRCEAETVHSVYFKTGTTTVFRYHCRPCAVARVASWKRRKAAERAPWNPYGVIHDYFGCVNSATKAYVLGLLAADGYVLANLNRVGLEMALSDRAIVDFVRDELAPKAPIHERPAGRGGFKAEPHVVLTVHSQQLVQDLAKFEICDRKSLILQWPTALPRKWERPFLLGYFDGDGWLTATGGWGICSGSHTFLEAARQRLEPVAGTDLAVGPHGRNTSQIFTACKPAARALDAWLHADGLGLQRKSFAGDVVCAVQGCPERTWAKGWCQLHYNRWAKHGSATWEPSAKPAHCIVKDCPKPVKGHGYCDKHYALWRRNGSPERQKLIRQRQRRSRRKPEST